MPTVGAASMEAGNGYPANMAPTATSAAMCLRFNGGREWLPGKPGPEPEPPPPPPQLQWRPGMVTRQTRTSLPGGSANGWLQWRPGMVTRQTLHPQAAAVAVSTLQWRPGMVTRQTCRHRAAPIAAAPLQWRPGMVTRQTLVVVLERMFTRGLQWRPGMVTRQTSPSYRCPRTCAGASMEAGNGYPANRPRKDDIWVIVEGFNGGREWLPGKHRHPPVAAVAASTLQWRPGMVTRQTRRTLLVAARSPPSFNGGREWLPGKHHTTYCPPSTWSRLQWRPGMVTRQTFAGWSWSSTTPRLQWRPGMVTRQTPHAARCCSFPT